MANVPFALGMLKTHSGNWALLSADASKAASMTTSYEGKLPKTISNAGGVVLGVGPDNGNYSWGTFFEGAIVAGSPTATTDTAVLQNIQAVGYGQK
jgi:hypothetical protein